MYVNTTKIGNEPGKQQQQTVKSGFTLAGIDELHKGAHFEWMKWIMSDAKWRIQATLAILKVIHTKWSF